MAIMYLSKQKIIEVVDEIKNFLDDNNMSSGCKIYFNGVAYVFNKKYSGWYVIPDKNPEDYFKYVRSPNIISMSFKGDFCKALNGLHPLSPTIRCKLKQLLEKYGLYYKLGDYWNLTCYEI